MNQDRIKNQILSGQIEAAFASLYRYYPKVERHIRRNSGSRDEALDVFQEALIIFHRKITTSSDYNFSFEGFLINTGKLLWSNQLRKKGVRSGDETGLGILTSEDGIQELVEKERKIVVIEGVLKNLGEKCRKILDLFYYRKKSMEEIATEFGFSTIQSAKVQKFKCLETARDMALGGEIDLCQDFGGYKKKVKSGTYESAIVSN